MTRWTCPACGRSFGRGGQGHMCVPTIPLGEFIEAQVHRAVFEAALSFVRTLPEVEIEAAYVGLLVKRRRTFVELRPRQKWVVLSFVLSRTIDHPRITRTTPASTNSMAHFVRLTSPVDVDDTIRNWIAMSYEDCA